MSKLLPLKVFKMTKFPLHMHIATMFILLTMTLGAIQIWFNYHKNSELIKQSSILQYENVMQRAAMDLSAKYTLAANSVAIMAKSELALAKNLPERLKFIPVLSTILQGNKAVSGFEVGYKNGDFFIIRVIDSDYMRKQFNAPINTAFLVDDLKAPDNPATKMNIRVYYDKYLHELKREILEGMTYDPRVRPWYKLALRTKGYATTQPYLYYFVKKVGLSITQQSKVDGVVIAADIELDDISSILKENIITPSSELVLLSEKGKVIAYKDPNKLITQNSQGIDEIASISDLQSQVLKSNKDLFQAKEHQINFEFLNQHWGGVVKKFDIHTDFKIFFAFIAPDDELFSKAIEIRWQSSFIALMLMLLAVPITAYCAYLISKPIRRLTLQTQKIRQFDFSSDKMASSIISEISILSKNMDDMKLTIDHFLTMINALASDKNLGSLLNTITQQTLDVSRADAVVLFMLNEERDQLVPVSVKLTTQIESDISLSPHLVSNNKSFLVNAFQQSLPQVQRFYKKKDGYKDALKPFFEKLTTENLQILTLPLTDRSGVTEGIICVVNNFDNEETDDLANQDRISFMQALSGFALVSMEGRHLLKSQVDLVASIIQLIAGSIDAKSHYTAGHCKRVPELTTLLTQEVCKQTEGEFKEFTLTKEQWAELDIASWMHDCGKISTPEFVVDKATKLETIYDRIHEIRMRFEVLKCNAETEYWQSIATGEDSLKAQDVLNQKRLTLDDDFAFVAASNVGGEFMSQSDMQRIQDISLLTWKRTLSDRMGISWEETNRKEKTAEPKLPIMESILADKIEHIIERHPKDVLNKDNQWGFNMHSPEHQYNRGEIYNLCISKGTLNAEERYKINEHMVQTIVMLDALKLPTMLRNVAEIAGGHHEKMDGTGFPKGLKREEMSIPARIMAIADIFEALTAADRPYKKAKRLSETIKIMHHMKRDNHIDGPLFDIFLRSGIYLQYAEKYLSGEQMDYVDINVYLNTASH
jgi:HD-GYP domain-containing protein (c-di-GMP phosphodiesterase class II)